MAEAARIAPRAEVLALFSNLREWRRGDERAPHKPLLLLYALGRCARGEPREVPSRVERSLTPDWWGFQRAVGRASRLLLL